jgi:putative N6-adenine-specific DNA methylase
VIGADKTSASAKRDNAHDFFFANLHTASILNSASFYVTRSTNPASIMPRILVTCPKRITPYLRAEMEALDFPVLQEFPKGVATEGTMDDALKLNLHIRTGHRVLLQLKKFYLRSPDDLHKSISTIPWEDYIPLDGYFSVMSSVQTASINNTMYANVKCKDAIADRFRKTFGRRPDSGSETDGVVIFLYWNDDECYVYLDTSGEPLSKRGYRTMPWKAPMRETLAAATIMASRWDAASAFVNPMCGSGTLAIEAALMALHKAPGLDRTNFAFMHLTDYGSRYADVWDALCAAARKTVVADDVASAPFPIIASDISAEAIAAARHNAAAAGVERFITFEVCDVVETPMPASENGSGLAPVVMLNPEYGERLGDTSTLAAEYARIGDFFKQHCAGYTGYVFTGNLEAAKRLGLKAKRRVEFWNGDIDCRLLEYELYQGTKRVFTP